MAFDQALGNTLQSAHQILGTLSPLSYAVISVNLILIFFAHPILNRFSSGQISPKAMTLRIMVMRSINVAIVSIYIYSEIAQHDASHSFGVKLLSILAILYCTYLSNYFCRYYIFKIYGKQRSIGGKNEYIETYQSRAFSLIASLLLTILALISCIHQLGAESMLQAGGVVGIIGITIGLTQQSWAPDIISGLILLHSDAIIEGDVVELPNQNIGLIHKTKMFHTEILDLANNHRIMIRNALLRDLVLHNLSKFASAKGLRECLNFNIGYEVDSNKVKAMFKDATEAAKSASIPFEETHDTDVKLFETGDHAIKWGYIYYVKNVEQLVSIRRDMRETILSTAQQHGISLATPMTHNTDIKITPNDQHKIEPKNS